MTKTKRINLISGPRNISTALMYSFSNRSDTTAVDEPMYACYLHKSGSLHPMREEILEALPITMEDVKRELIFCETAQPIYFIKGMAKHYYEIDPSFILDLDNVFLIRDPRQLLHSFIKVIAKPQMEDIGLKREYELYKLLMDNNKSAIVLDSNEVLKNPEKVLAQLCHKLDIPFSSKMLNWPKGPSKYDGVWAPHWYKNVHQSTTFSVQNAAFREIKSELMPLLEECQHYYDLLSQSAIRA